ncbi:MAG: hypothetical protein VXY89_13610, partial [SAR324 cluster bacterium]|nr:hypothetical protein [SAR324 cluster bacterium]
MPIAICPAMVPSTFFPAREKAATFASSVVTEVQTEVSAVSSDYVVASAVAVGTPTITVPATTNAA